MTQQADAFPRDVNRTPMTDKGFVEVVSKNLTASNTTAAVPLFSVTGQCVVEALYGIVTVQPSNCTAVFFRLNDGSVQTDITLSSGSILTSTAVGTIFSRRNISTSVVTITGSGQGRIQDPAAATAPSVHMPFIAAQKAGGGETNIEFVYTTTATPLNGAADFYIGWLPLTPTSYISVI